METVELKKKKRLMIKCTDGDTINISADRLLPLSEDANFIVAYNDGEIVGVFDLGIVHTLYIQESSK